MGVAGSRSGAGKTVLACGLLSRLAGWGALKVSTLHGNPHPGSQPGSLVVDPSILSRTGSDTARLLAAGAARVGWLTAPPAGMAEAVEGALRQLGDLPGVIVEGNSAVAAIQPDAVALVFAEGEADLKASARPLVSRATWLVAHRPAARSPEDPWPAWAADYLDRCRRFAGRPDPATEAFLDEVRAWFLP